MDTDKQTYLRYKKIQDQNLKSILGKMVTRKHNKSKSDTSYGIIKMDDNHNCPFLDEQKLCIVHGRLGEEYLSETCALYPRYLHRVDGKFERSATISCPEIARIVLLNPNGFALEQIEEDENIRIKVHSIFDTEGRLYLNKPQRYFWEIRLFALSLLQNRDYSLGERLIILGMVYKNIAELVLDNAAGYIPEFLELMTVRMGQESFKEELTKIPVNTQIQMKLAKELTDEKVIQGVSSTRYLECLNETLLGIGHTEGEEIKNVLKKYEQNYTKYVIPYLEEKEYILENYLVNEFFRELMPFGSFKSMWDSYIFLCVLYSMVKLHLIGMAGYHKGLNDELVIKLIQSFSKVVLHSSAYIQGIIKLLKDNDLDSLAYMSILVKN